MEAALRPLERLGRRIGLLDRTEDVERAVGQEHEPCSRAKYAVPLAYPEVRIAPETRAVLGDGEVERSIGQGDVLGIRLDQRKCHSRLLLHPTGGVELCRCQVDADGPRTSAGKVRCEVRSPAPELDDIQPCDVAEHAELVL